MVGDLTASGVFRANDAAFAYDLSGSSAGLNLRIFMRPGCADLHPLRAAFTGTGTLDLTA